jgi:ribonuclease HI
MTGERGKAGKIAARLRHLAARLEQGSPPEPKALTALERDLERWEELPAAQEPSKDAPPGEVIPPLPGQPLSNGEGPFRIWCDGSCSPNPGAGGWGAIVEQGGNRRELNGAHPATTNNVMEMTAAIEALRITPPGAVVVVTTDSQYVKNGITSWIHAWKRKGWRKADGQPVLNQDLWRALDALVGKRTVRWEWVRGHTGHPENERCDELANAARLGLG